MPRIDPQKLLNCLSVLLAPNGGIRSASQVIRLIGLMGRFSKKLVSKCIYIQILKCTETELLGQFMFGGGWSLAYTWLNDGIVSKNWPLVQEILELLLLCPVDVQRLKSNSAPKLVKQLSKEGGVEAVRILATRLVEQWLKIVKGESTSNAAIVEAESSSAVAAAAAASSAVNGIIIHAQTNGGAVAVTDEVEAEETAMMDTDENVDDEAESTAAAADPLAIAEDERMDDVGTAASVAVKSNEKLVFKITVKDGKQVLAKVDTSSSALPTSTSSSSSSVKRTNPSENCLDPNDAPSASKISKVADDVVTTASATATAQSAPIEEIDGKSVNNKDKCSSSSSSNNNNNGKGDGKIGKNSDRSRDKNRRDKERSDRDRIGSDKDRKERSKDDAASKSSGAGESKSSSSKKSSSSSSSGHRSSSSSNHKSSSSSKYSSSSSSRRDSKESSDRDKYKSSSSKSSSSSRSKSSTRDKDSGASSRSFESKISQADKDKDTLAKVIPPSITKLAKIPKKISNADDDSVAAVSLAASSNVVAAKKASISIEIRKDTENRPKTVKTFNSQFRSHGLAEEAPPPPSRRGLKKPSSTSTPGTSIPPSTTKSQSPPPPQSDALVVNEKRAKIEAAASATSATIEKPGAIKLIAPKPKPSLLVESDMFMDALSAATTSKKSSSAASKRKRLTSKDGQPTTPEPTTPPAVVANRFGNAGAKEKDTVVAAESLSPPRAVTPTTVVAPLKFYQDTLTTNTTTNDTDNKDEEKSLEPNSGDDDDDEDDDDDKPLNALLAVKGGGGGAGDSSSSVSKSADTSKEDKLDDDAAATEAAAVAKDDELLIKPKPPGPGCGENGPPGVLVVHRRKGPKKQLRWRPLEHLEEIRYFELDENERVNVTKTFVDMKQMERTNEREGFLMARKLNAEDTMVEQIAWTMLFEVEDVPAHPSGAQSKERQVQLDREQNCLKVLYFNRLMIPDNPAEAEMEPYQFAEPQIIPLDDATGNPDAVNDFTAMPWPEPRGSPPHKGAVAVDESNVGIGGLPFPINGGPFNQFPFPPKGQMGGGGPGPGHGGPNMWPNMDGGMGGGPPLGGPGGGGMMGGPPNGPPMFNGMGMPPMGPPMHMNDMMNGPPNMGGGGGGMPPPPFGPGGPNFNGPPGFNNFGPGGPPPPMHDRGRGGRWFGGPNGPPPHNNWRGGGGGGGGGGGNRSQWMNRSRICKSFQRGFCRNGDSCNFMHPGINCPPM